MATDPVRYIINDLSPTYDREFLESTRTTLAKAIVIALNDFETRLDYGVPSAAIPKLYTGQAGVAVATLRLSVQGPLLRLPDTTIHTLRALTSSILQPCFSDMQRGLSPAASPDARVSHEVLHFGRCGVMISPVGPAVVEITRQILTGDDADGDEERFEQSIRVLQAGYEVCFEASPEQIQAGDMVELMWGTAGFLYGLLGLLSLLEGKLATTTTGMWRARDSRLVRLTSLSSIESVFQLIIFAGINGAELLRQSVESGTPTPPLMWRDFRVHWSLGGIHGVAGVLLILVQCPREMIDPYLQSHILPTLDWLISMQRSGNTARDYPLGHAQPAWQCQFCHGVTGTALLYAGLRVSVPETIDGLSEESRARKQGMTEALDFLWKEGLVRKGIGICHGVTGNAMPFLLHGVLDLQEGVEESLSLGRALAMLNLSVGLPPLNLPQSEQALTLPGNEPAFRTPDHPYNLFEGLAGAVCVWADALVLLNAMSSGAELGNGMIGFPLVGGLGVRLPL